MELRNGCEARQTRSVSTGGPTISFFLTSLCVVTIFGCTGNITQTSDPFGDSATGAKGDGAAEVVLDQPETMPLRRLTRDELTNTVRDLLLIQDRIGDGFPRDPVGPAGFYEPGRISTLEAQYLLESVERLSSVLTPRMQTLVGCDLATGEAKCARFFIENFGKRAYRRPLEVAEIDRLLTFFNQAKTLSNNSFMGAALMVVQTMLQSPNFLYHRESGSRAVLRDGVVTLDPYGTASRLSYFLWASMPDKELFEAADQGRLNTREDVSREAVRMMADPRFGEVVGEFHLQWLEMDELEMTTKDPAMFPQYTPQLVSAMRRETMEFAKAVVLSDGKFKSLMTAPYTYLNADLAALYGLPTAGLTAQTFQKVDLSGKRRSGILTQPAFLSMGANLRNPLPPARGLRILEQVLCQTAPTPPPNVPAVSEGPTQTNRQRFEEHVKNGCAAACHGVIDPIGFAFENYDAIGQFRTTDNGYPVDASGKVSFSRDEPVREFRDALDLSTQLAESPVAANCWALHWFRFGLGRREAPGDGASLKSATEKFRGSDTDLKALITQIVRSRSFLERAPSEGEVFQ